jgi:beclin 1
MEGGAPTESSETDRERLEEECRGLRSRLENVRKRRQRIKILMDREMSDQLSQWEQRYNEVSHEQSEALADYRSAARQENLTANRLDVAQKWNVINDCFYIWHRGPFGTINGLRLASEVPALPTDPSKSETTSEATAAAATANGGKQGGILGYSLGFSGESNLTTPTETTISVPWAEVNSALGLVALLLSTLQHKPNSSFHFKNEIVAMGSTSKIGVRRGESITYYDLYTDDNFHFFGKRNFNIALTGLVRCVAEAEETVQERDRTIALPHAIDASARGEMTIGGLPIAYGPDGEQWTRAMKYLLTDIKWLLCGKG